MHPSTGQMVQNASFESVGGVFVFLRSTLFLAPPRYLDGKNQTRPSNQFNQSINWFFSLASLRRYLDGKNQMLYPEPRDVFPCDLIHSGARRGTGQRAAPGEGAARLGRPALPPPPRWCCRGARVCWQEGRASLPP